MWSSWWVLDDFCGSDDVVCAFVRLGIGSSASRVLVVQHLVVHARVHRHSVPHHQVAQRGARGAIITISGSADAWFGVGFGATAMSNAPYAVIVSGTDGVVQERVLGDQSPGVALNASVAVLNHTVHDILVTHSKHTTSGIIGIKAFRAIGARA